MALANDGEKDGRRRFCFEKSLDLIRGLEVRGGRLIIRQFHITRALAASLCLYTLPFCTSCSWNSAVIVEFLVVRIPFPATIDSGEPTPLQIGRAHV